MNALAPDQRTEPLRPHAEQAYAAELAALEAADTGRGRPAGGCRRGPWSPT